MYYPSLTDDELLHQARWEIASGQPDPNIFTVLVDRWDQREEDHAETLADAGQEADQAIERLEDTISDARDAVEALMESDLMSMTTQEIEDRLWRIREDLY